MKKVTVHQAKTNLSKLLLAVSAGEVVEIARGGVPVARLVAVERKPRKRKAGKYKGKITISDDFDSPLPAKFAKAFK